MALLKRENIVTDVDRVNNTDYLYIIYKARSFRSNNDIRRTLIKVKIYKRVYIIKSNANNFRAEIKATNATTTVVYIYI